MDSHLAACEDRLLAEASVDRRVSNRHGVEPAGHGPGWLARNRASGHRTNVIHERDVASQGKASDLSLCRYFDAGGRRLKQHASHDTRQVDRVLGCLRRRRCSLAQFGTSVTMSPVGTGVTSPPPGQNRDVRY